MKSYTLWDITPRNPLKVNRRFGETYRFCLQGPRISQARNQHEAGIYYNAKGERNKLPDRLLC
jgi:hypothetical protein